MADEHAASSRPEPQENAPLAVNLHIVSPSAGVGNLRFPDIPATTTIRQLRERIRESLSSRPADDHQRLIHRGRLLARDTDTLQDIFGEEAIRTTEQQTIHLVLRDMGDAPPVRDAPPRQLPHALRNPPNAAIPRAGSAPIGAPQVMAHFPQFPQLHQNHVQQQELLQRMNQLQQSEANYRQMMAYQHNHRAAMAAQNAQDPSNNSQAGGADAASGRNSPVGQAFRTVTREGIGPDGQRYSFRITLNEVITPTGSVPRAPAGPGPIPDPVGPRPLSAADVRNILHGADANRAAQTMASAMQRNAAGEHPANMAAELAHFNFNSPIQPIQPGVTTPIFPGVSRNASRAATPDLSARSVSHGSGIGLGGLQASTQQQQGRPEVYILSSPSGPRGLLINNGSEVYTTPAFRPPSLAPNFYRSMIPPSLFNELPGAEDLVQHGPGQSPGHLQAPHAQSHQSPLPLGQQPLPQPPVQQQPLPQAPQEHQPAIRRRPVAGHAVPPAAAEAQPAPQLNPHGNPGMAPLVAAAWPHVWLVIRLVAFAWWFSYTNPSWERWLSLVLAFVAVFAVNTGLFNGVVNNAFHPVREQLEGMIPFADPNRPEQQQQQEEQNQPEGTGNNQEGANGANPDPAQTAARLVAQRRTQNRNWLRDHIRRIERAGILFLASFAPGVAERHIQQLEERERAERRAAEEARAAAAAAQQEAEQASASENPEGQEEHRNEDESQGAVRQEQTPGVDVQHQPPLVEV
ncbi:hypothetical protein P885DRAFT_41126 [Corynascus similis CBS 632.67]